MIMQTSIIETKNDAFAEKSPLTILTQYVMCPITPRQMHNHRMQVLLSWLVRQFSSRFRAPFEAADPAPPSRPLRQVSYLHQVS